jgi:nucleoside-diphosphate-sugar epimerase
MRQSVLVTGANGRLGSAVVDEFASHGIDVVAVDRTPLPTRTSAARFHHLEGNDLAGLVSAMQGCSGVVHLAAIPHPVEGKEEVVFGNNTGATFAALQAAVMAGITRVVIASSVSAYGTAWSAEPTTFDYVPVDEDHPMRNADPYGLSKEVDERTAEMFSRRAPMTVVALRFHWLATPEEQQERVRTQPEEGSAEDLRVLWGYVDVRDAARACRLALEAAADQSLGFVPINIVAADVLAKRPLKQLLASHAPHVQVRAELDETAGGFSIDRAREVIGWEPQHSWRQ